MRLARWVWKGSLGFHAYVRTAVLAANLLLLARAMRGAAITVTPEMTYALGPSSFAHHRHGRVLSPLSRTEITSRTRELRCFRRDSQVAEQDGKSGHKRDNHICEQQSTHYNPLSRRLIVVTTPDLIQMFEVAGHTYHQKRQADSSSS